MEKRKVRDLVKELRDAIQMQLPEDVEAVISLDIRLKTMPVKSDDKPAANDVVTDQTVETDQTEQTAETEQTEKQKIDMEGLRATLNAFVKTAGKEAAFALVEKYTGGSKNPADIPPDKYNDLMDDMSKAELAPAGEAA